MNAALKGCAAVHAVPAAEPLDVDGDEDAAGVLDPQPAATTDRIAAPATRAISLHRLVITFPSH